MNTIDLTGWPMKHILAPHKTWDTIDSSKLQTFATCPRKFFYEYILGWRMDYANIDLIFGESWHRAKEHMLLTGNRDIEGAMIIFLDYYRQYFDETTDLDKMPKNPGNAILALTEYKDQYGTDEFEVEVLDGVPMTEIYGTIPIDESRIISFRLDAVVNTKKGKKFIDSKTSKMLSNWWTEQWSLSLQMGLYLHVINSLYPDNNDGGVIDGSIFRKGGNAQIRVELRKSFAMIQDWHWGFLDMVNNVAFEYKRLEEASPDHSIMKAFPKNPEGCFKYNRICAFHAFCTAWDNPLQKCESPPLGMKQEWWDPSDTGDRAKHSIKVGGSE